MGWAPAKYAAEMIKLSVRSSVDDSSQPSRLLPAAGPHPRPLLVALPTWMGDWTQNLDGFFQEARTRGWHCLQPNARGANCTPQACASPLAMRDVIDAMAWVADHYPVDETRVYLAGGSGGGHLAMMLAATYPERFTAVSAWCGITDLEAWHEENRARDDADGYAGHIEACLGGSPGTPGFTSAARSRSPRHHLANAAGLPLDISAGVRDGRDGSVPFWHSVWAFNVLAEAQGDRAVTAEEIRQLWEEGKLRTPSRTDVLEDPLYEGRAIHLRRPAGLARLTIFEGGHDLIPGAAVPWLSCFRRNGDRFIVQSIPTEGPHVSEDASIMKIDS